MDYRVALEMYKGPLDLLLYLIRENEVDIQDIPIASITEQYLRYLEPIKMIDPNAVGEFLVMAATLMEIKSRMLLPRIEEEEAQAEEGDPRLELVRQLMEYKRYKEMAAELGERGELQAQKFPRPAVPGEEGQPGGEIDLAEVSVWDLLQAFDRMMKATLGKLPTTIVDLDIPVKQHMEMIIRMLRAQGAITFLSIFERCRDRVQVVGAFIAVLEMVRQRVVTAEQSHDRDEIRIRLRDESRIPDMLASASLAERQMAEGGSAPVDAAAEGGLAAEAPSEVETPAEVEASSESPAPEPPQESPPQEPEVEAPAAPEPEASPEEPPADQAPPEPATDELDEQWRAEIAAISTDLPPDVFQPRAARSESDVEEVAPPAKNDADSPEDASADQATDKKS